MAEAAVSPNEGLEGAAVGGTHVRGRPPAVIIVLGPILVLGGFADSIYAGVTGTGTPGDLANPVLINAVVGEVGLLLATVGVLMDTAVLRVINVVTTYEIPFDRIRSVDGRHGFQVWTDSSTAPIEATAFGSSVLGEIVHYPRSRRLAQACMALLDRERAGRAVRTGIAPPVRRLLRTKSLVIGTIALFVLNAVPVIVSGLVR